ncbi:FCD domain-containing protein [Nocardia lijiangensis]|uniref:FCD domain-containing protein n=1 Tax=Nocardia lijiangensis TaxID=299618 RepID=UPI003D72DAD1
MSARELEQLGDVVPEYGRAMTAGDTDRIVTLGREFHRRINLAADSHRLVTALGSIVKTVTRLVLRRYRGSHRTDAPFPSGDPRGAAQEPRQDGDHADARSHHVRHQRSGGRARRARALGQDAKSSA